MPSAQRMQSDLQRQARVIKKFTSKEDVIKNNNNNKNHEDEREQEMKNNNCT